MKKITISVLLLCSLLSTINIWASSFGSIPKPFCAPQEAIEKVEQHFKEWFINEIKWNNKEEGEKRYQDIFIEEIRYTNFYDSARGNLLNDKWSWVIKFQDSKDLTHSYTYSLNKSGKIELINVTK